MQEKKWYIEKTQAVLEELHNKRYIDISVIHIASGNNDIKIDIKPLKEESLNDHKNFDRAADFPIHLPIIIILKK